MIEEKSHSDGIRVYSPKMDSKARRIFGIEFPKDAFMRYGGAFIFIMLSWHLDLVAQELDLDDLRWKNRVLLLVTGTGDTSFINEQSGLFSDLQLELLERKLILIDVKLTNLFYQVLKCCSSPEPFKSF